LVGYGVLGAQVGFFIAPCPVLYVDSGDILALFAGIAIVIFVAIMANPHYLSGLQISQEGLVKPSETDVQTQISVPLTPEYPKQIPVTTPVLPKPDALPTRIFYTDKPFSYPVYKLPDHMETFGASEIPWRTNEWVPFAFIENTRGGLTQVFSVPYPVWVINTTVVAEHHPQYSNLRLALCFADTGGIIEGEEILSQGTSYRIVQISNADMYMIISANSIDRFRITLETPRGYYDTYRPR
jgi:hypothetical protein